MISPKIISFTHEVSLLRVFNETGPLECFPRLLKQTFKKLQRLLTIWCWPTSSRGPHSQKDQLRNITLTGIPNKRWPEVQTNIDCNQRFASRSHSWQHWKQWDPCGGSQRRWTLRQVGGVANHTRSSTSHTYKARWTGVVSIQTSWDTANKFPNNKIDLKPHWSVYWHCSSFRFSCVSSPASLFLSFLFFSTLFSSIFFSLPLCFLLFSFLFSPLFSSLFLFSCLFGRMLETPSTCMMSKLCRKLRNWIYGTGGLCRSWIGYQSCYSVDHVR